ncbi:hypothetical protein IPM62_03270 [Candidatus Woesebacteria bacterium]|nr:MAG: hypothetical protein IPM62_03270 [Candidatus Woesebacteria bacterium]
MNEHHENPEKIQSGKQLTEHDKVLLKNGALKIAQEVIQNYPGNLPDVIVLPDTSARPLRNLFDPIFRSIARQRGVRPPDFVFFQTPGGAQKIALRKVNDWGSIAEAKTATQETLINLKKGATLYKWFRDRKTHQENDRQIQEQRKVLQEVDKVPEILNQQKLRAKEIVSSCATPDPNIVIIDDTMIRSGRTIKLIRTAFGDNTENIRGYVLTAHEPLANNVFSAQEIDINSPDAVHPLDYMRDNPDHEGSLRDAYGVEKSDVLIDPYVQVIRPRSKQTKILRREMSQIGKDIAKKLREDGYSN